MLDPYNYMIYSEERTHHEYARKTLYAYMPCLGLQGLDYIDNVVDAYYSGDYRKLLQDFVQDELNIWCPTWVRQNYNVRNQLSGAHIDGKPRNEAKPPDATHLLPADNTAPPQKKQTY